MGGSSQRSRSSSNSTTTQSESGGTQTSLGSTPFALGQLPNYQTEFERAQTVDRYAGPVQAQLEYSGDFTPVQGDVSGFVAQGTDAERQGLDMAMAAAGDGAGGLGGLTSGTAQNLANYWNDVTAGGPGGILESAPYQTLLDTLSTENQETLDFQNARISDIFAGSGGWAGTDQARAMAFATEEAAEAQANQQAQLGYNAFLFGHDLMGRADEGAASAFNLGQLPGQTMTQLGEQERGLNQLALDEELAQTNWAFTQGQQEIENALRTAQLGQANEQAQIANDIAANEALREGDLDLYERFFDTLTSGAFGQNIDANTFSRSTSSGTSTSTGSGSDSGQTMSGIGSLISAAALAAMAFWSDERLKENVRKVGEHKGLNWYVFRFSKWAQELLGCPSGWQFGVLAQEVWASPLHGAVLRAENGLLMVDYKQVV